MSEKEKRKRKRRGRTNVTIVEVDRAIFETNSNAVVINRDGRSVSLEITEGETRSVLEVLRMDVFLGDSFDGRPLGRCDDRGLSVVGRQECLLWLLPCY